MIEFDNDKKILSYYKVKKRPFAERYKKNASYESYMDYIHNGLLYDIENIVIPQWNSVIEEYEGVPRIWFVSGRVVKDKTANYMGEEFWSVFVKVGCNIFPKGTREFCIFKIPVMDEDGVVHKGGKYYSIYNTFSQDADVTFNEKKDVLKIVTAAGNISIQKNKSDVKLWYTKKSVFSAFSVMYALAESEGISGVDLFNKYTDYYLSNMYKGDEQALMVDAMFAKTTFENTAGRDILGALENNKRSLKDVRDRLNQVLSIDRCLGRCLFKRITLNDGREIPSDTIITPTILQSLKSSRINEVYVKRIPQMQGHFLVDDIELPLLRKGTEVLDCLTDALPNVAEAYLTSDLDLSEHPVIIPEGTQVTQGLLEMLAYNGVEVVKLKATLTSSKCVTVSFSAEIIGNRHFLVDGKWKYINERGEVSEPKEFLCAYDVCALISLLCSLSNGYDFEYIADLDLGLRKKVDSAAEHFHKALISVTPKFFKKMTRAFRTLDEKDPAEYDVPDTMEAKMFGLADMWWKEMRSDENVIRPMEMLNPVEYLSSLSKVVTPVPDAHSISMEQRYLSMGHYGRICPYESPQSRMLGITNNFAIGCERGLDGKMRTPYYKIGHIGDKHFLTKEIVLLTTDQEETSRIGDITSLEIGKAGEILNKGRILARTPGGVGIEKVSISRVGIKDLDYVNVDPNQHIGLTTSTIPYIGADDAARVSFGQGMCKQAKPLEEGEAPIVMTDAFVDIPKMSKFYAVFSESSGTVLEVTDGRLVVQYYKNAEPTVYDYKPNEFVDGSVVVRSILVSEGQEFKEEEVLIGSNFVKDGLLAICRNALVGFMPTGYNYEDGDQMSVDFQQKLTSYGTVHEKTPLRGKFKQTRFRRYNKFYYHSMGDTAYTRELVTNNREIAEPVIGKRTKGFIVDVNIETDSMSHKDTATASTTVSFDSIHAGDKIANRHGNKGVVPLIEENNKMARLLNGIPLDLEYNPCGVSSRMIVGQILECNTGLCGKILDIRILTPPFNGMSTEEVQDLMNYTWSLANEDDAKAVIARYPQYPESLHKHCLERIGLIRGWKGVFDTRGRAYLFNPRTGKMTEQPVLIGVNAIYKLEHEVGKKVHGRAGLCSEPYVKKKDSPTESSAKLGGQRQGSMELDAFCAYGAAGYVDEMINSRGDNSIARNNLTVDAIHTGNKYKISSGYSMRRSTEEFITTMMGLGCKIEFDQGELPNIDRDYIEGKYNYDVNTLKRAADSNKLDASVMDNQMIIDYLSKTH